MGDIRAILTDALQTELEIRMGTVHNWADHIAGVLLSLPGVAILELPEHDSDRYEGDEHEPDDRLCWMPGDDFEVSVWYHGEVQRCGTGWGDLEPLSVAEARTIAAALLAAADAAEQVADD